MASWFGRKEWSSIVQGWVGDIAYWRRPERQALPIILLIDRKSVFIRQIATTWDAVQNSWPRRVNKMRGQAAPLTAEIFGMAGVPAPPIATTH